MKIKTVSWHIVYREAQGFSGLGLLGYGLYLYQPWLSLSVVGFILFSTAFAASIWDNR